MKVKSITTLKVRGRWIIVLPAAHDWAWSETRWIHHRGGVSLEGHVTSFETEQLALDYAVEHCIAREKEPKK